MGGRRSRQPSTGGARISAASGSRSRGTATAAGSATGHHARDRVLPSSRPAATVPPAASRVAAGQAPAPVSGARRRASRPVAAATMPALASG